MTRPLANISGELLQRGYVLLGRLSRGEASTVYEAQHEGTRRRLAIKVTAGDTPDAERNAGRVLTAWNVARGLRHPHLVTVIDGGRLSDGRAWLVMERLRGRDLGMELDEVGRLPAARAVHIVRQVADALGVLHRRGAVHRDVNPRNIFLVSAGHFADHVRLIDLGHLAVGRDDPQRMHAPTGPVMLGTPLYLAPELARGEDATPASDAYSLGAVLHHLIAGAPPYHDAVATRLIALHVNAPIPSLPAETDAPLVLAGLVARCLAKSPADRPGEMAEVMAVLDDCLVQLAGGTPGEVSVAAGAPAAPAVAKGLPAIPPAGIGSEWRRFADALWAVLRARFPRDRPPAPVSETLAWVTAARTELDEQSGLAERHRATADIRAGARIEARSQLEARLEALDAMLEDAAGRLREAEHLVFAEVKLRGGIDEQYRGALRALEVAAGGEHHHLGLDEFGPLLAEVRSHLARRAEVDARVTAHRASERAVAEQLAMLMAERLEVARAHADGELLEQDEGWRLECLAAQSSDAMLAAQRAFENACLHLYQRCLALRAVDATASPRVDA